MVRTVIRALGKTALVIVVIVGFYALMFACSVSGDFGVGPP